MTAAVDFVQEVVVTLFVIFCLIVLIDLYPVVQTFVMLIVASGASKRTWPAEKSSVRPEVTILVPCFNEEKVLSWTIDSIFMSRGVDVARVICIDDGSTDGTLRVMRAAKRRHGEVVMILQQANMGKAAALNHGLRMVDTEFFVSIDADTQVTPEAINRLLTNFHDCDEVAAVSGQMLVGNRVPSNRDVFAAQVREYEFANNIDRLAFSRMRCSTVVPGAIGAFRTADVRSVGGYPDGTLSEDAHLTFMLLMRGHRIVHEPSATVLTEAPDTISGLLRQRVRWATGKTQVVLRTSRAILRQRTVAKLIWLHTVVNQAVLPLLTLLSQVGTVAVPVLLALVVAHGGADSPAAAYLPAMIALAVFVTLAQLASFLFSTKFARGSDARAREAAGLACPRMTLLSSIVIPVMGFVAAWVAWYAILTGRRKSWNKLDRTGDVRLPTAS